MSVDPTPLQTAIGERLATLVEAGHDPEQVALAALDAACGFLCAARGPQWLAERLEIIARGLTGMLEAPSGHSTH